VACSTLLKHLKLETKAQIDVWPARGYTGVCKEFVMFYIVGSLVVAVILFALCKTSDRTLDAERDFWIKARQVLDQSKK